GTMPFNLIEAIAVRPHLAAWLLLLFAGGAAHAASKEEALVDLVIGAPHGLSPLSGPEVEKGRKQIAAHPDAYLPILKARVDLQNLDKLDDEGVRRLANAGALLSLAGAPGT